jgi:hypothetical protein
MDFQIEPELLDDQTSSPDSEFMWAIDHFKEFVDQGWPIRSPSFKVKSRPVS